MTFANSNRRASALAVAIYFCLPAAVCQDRTALPVVTSWREPDLAAALAWSPSKPLLATLRRDGTITVRDTTTWEVKQTLQGVESLRGAIAFSPNGRWLATGGDNRLRVWKVGRKWQRIVDHELTFDDDEDDALEDEDAVYVPTLSEISTMLFSRNSKHLYLGGDAAYAEIWDTKTWQRQGHIVDKSQEIDDETMLTSLALANRGRAVVTGGTSPAIQIWSAKQKKWLSKELVDNQAKHLQNEGTDLRVSPNGKTIALGGALRGGRLQIIDARHAKLLHDKPVKAGYIPAVDFAHDGASVYAASLDFCAYDVKSGALLREFTLPAMALVLRRSPDGQFVAISCEDEQVRIYRVIAEQEK